MKVINDASLVSPPDMVKVVKENIGLAFSESANLAEHLLKFKNMPVQEIDF